MYIGQLIYPKKQHKSRFLKPLWKDAIGIIVANEPYNYQYYEPTTGENLQRKEARWIVLINSELISATNTLIGDYFESR